MKKFITTLICLCFPALVVAKNLQLDDLKQKKATQYDIGKIRLDILRFYFGNLLDEREIADTNLKVYNFSTSDNDNSLFLTAILKGKSKYIKKDTCKLIKNRLEKRFKFSKISEYLWPEESDLSHLAIFQVVLISWDNEEFTIKC